MATSSITSQVDITTKTEGETLIKALEEAIEISESRNTCENCDTNCQFGLVGHTCDMFVIKYDNTRDNPESPCYKCVNYHWGCPADDWDVDDIPLKNGEPFDTNCHSSIR